MVRQYPSCYALQYQCDDRFRHEVVEDMCRLELAKYERKVGRSGWQGNAWGARPWNQSNWQGDDDESTYDPDNKWDHIYYLMVHGAFAINWWLENYVLHAQDVRHKVDTLDSKLDKDAPIAASTNEHPMGVLKTGINSFAAVQPKGGGKDKNERKRLATTAFDAAKAKTRWHLRSPSFIDQRRWLERTTGGDP